MNDVWNLTERGRNNSFVKWVVFRNWKAPRIIETKRAVGADLGGSDLGGRSRGLEIFKIFRERMPSNPFF